VEQTWSGSDIGMTWTYKLGSRSNLTFSKENMIFSHRRGACLRTMQKGIKMNIALFMVVSIFFSMLTLVSSVSKAYAEENINHINQAFLYGEYGNLDAIPNCPGACSAAPSRTVGMGYRFEFIPYFSDEFQAATLNFEYWRAQYVINGIALEATKKEINSGLEINFDEQGRYALSMGPGISWMTVNGSSSLSRTTPNPLVVTKLIAQVSSSLAVTLGYTHDFIFSANQSDFIANYVTFGVRWYL